MENQQISPESLFLIVNIVEDRLQDTNRFPSALPLLSWQKRGKSCTLDQNSGNGPMSFVNVF